MANLNITETGPDATVLKVQLIEHWKPEKDVWPFLYGDDAVGCLTILGSSYITFAFRKALSIRPYARLTCYSPVVGLSAIACYMFQGAIVSSDVLTANGCPLCISTKSALLQPLVGVGFPVVLAPMVCFYVADRLLTYPIPPLARAPWEVFNLFKKIVVKSTKPIMVLGVLHFTAAWFLTYQKQKSFFHVQSALKLKQKAV